MLRTGNVRVGFCLVALVGLVGGGAGQTGDLDVSDALAPDPASGARGIPGSLLVMADRDLFSSPILSYLPWSPQTQPATTPAEPTDALGHRGPDRLESGPIAAAELDLCAATGERGVPGSLLAMADSQLFSSPALSYLPWPPSSTPPRAPRPRVPDRLEGGPVEVGGDECLRYEYRDSFTKPWHREDATIEGLSSLHWEPEAGCLELRGARGRREVSLVYHFVAPYVMKDIVAELAGEIAGGGSDRIELALSTDGEDYGHAVGAFGRASGNRFLLTTNASARYHTCGFWVRIRGELSADACVRLSGFRLAGRVKPPGRAEVALEPAGGERLRYRDDFRSRKVFHLAEIENPAALGWQRGRIFVRGGDEPAQVEVRQKFVSPEPLRAVLVRVAHAAQGEGQSELGISLDGRTLLASTATPGDGAAGTTELRCEDPRLAQARHFFLHLRLAGAGDAASVVSRLEVEAQTAPPPTTTAAAAASIVRD